MILNHDSIMYSLNYKNYNKNNILNFDDSTIISIGTMLIMKIRLSR